MESPSAQASVATAARGLPCWEEGKASGRAWRGGGWPGPGGRAGQWRRPRRSRDGRGRQTPPGGGAGAGLQPAPTGAAPS